MKKLGRLIAVLGLSLSVGLTIANITNHSGSVAYAAKAKRKL